MRVLVPRRTDLDLVLLPLTVIAVLSLIAAIVILPVVATRADAADAEGCPGSTTLAAAFAWSGGAWSSSDGTTIAVSGDSSVADWTAPFKITAVVVTAGSVTLNYVYDPLETAGEIRQADIEGADGALSAIGFCTGSGAVPNPSSGSAISVGVAKTASCATANPDGSVTVTGTITIVRHSPSGSPPPVRIRVRAARDTVFAPGNVALARTDVAGLVGAVMETTASSISAPYTVTFTPGASTTFSNQAIVIVEEANSGLERHKYYSARASFGLCAAPTATPEESVGAATPTPTPEGSVGGATPTPEGSEGAATPTPGLPNTALGGGTDGGGTPLAVGGLILLLVSLGGLTVMRRSALRRR